jgi:hypothetical protein
LEILFVNFPEGKSIEDSLKSDLETKIENLLGVSIEVTYLKIKEIGGEKSKVHVSVPGLFAQMDIPHRKELARNIFWFLRQLGLAEGSDLHFMGIPMNEGGYFVVSDFPEF